MTNKSSAIKRALGRPRTKADSRRKEFRLDAKLLKQLEAEAARRQEWGEPNPAQSDILEEALRAYLGGTSHE